LQQTAQMLKTQFPRLSLTAKTGLTALQVVAAFL
jgi:hypothetical protein